MEGFLFTLNLHQVKEDEIGHVARIGENNCVRRIFVRNPEWNRPLGQRRCKWYDNIKWISKQ
jgi:hypothetical protein